MIISHEHRYIFVKTQKTAGTSIEIALSEFCGEHDVITPVSPEDEVTRRELGGRGPQNVERTLRSYGPKDWARLAIKLKKAMPYRNHLPAAYIQTTLPRGIWREYFKFCVERNPWDKVLSSYYWDRTWKARRGVSPMSLSEYLASDRWVNYSDWKRYTDRKGFLVDRVLRYENLEQELADVCKELGLPKLDLPRAKAGHRTDKRPYWDVIESGEQQRIAEVFNREIQSFGYSFGGSVAPVSDTIAALPQAGSQNFQPSK